MWLVGGWFGSYTIQLYPIVGNIVDYHNPCAGKIWESYLLFFGMFRGLSTLSTVRQIRYVGFTLQLGNHHQLAPMLLESRGNRIIITSVRIENHNICSTHQDHRLSSTISISWNLLASALKAIKRSSRCDIYTQIHILAKNETQCSMVGNPD